MTTPFTQAEQVLEDELVAQLTSMGYTLAAVTDEASMLGNLKAQLEAFNCLMLTAGEFTQVMHYLTKSAGVFSACCINTRLWLDLYTRVIRQRIDLIFQPFMGKIPAAILFPADRIIFGCDRLGVALSASEQIACLLSDDGCGCYVSCYYKHTAIQ